MVANNNRSFSLHHAWRVWKRLVVMNFRTNTTSWFEFVSYVFAKLMRMGFFFVFALALFRNTKALVGYSQGEVLLFFAIMNTLDVMLQLFCRGLTTVPQLIRRGEYDALLTKPLSPFFYSCFRMFDFMDLATAPAAIAFLLFAFQHLPYAVAPSALLLGSIVWLLSFVMITALNTFIVGLAFWLTEVESGIMIYRDLVYVGRFPPDIYPHGVRVIFTYFIPILLIVTTPTLVIIGRAQPSLLVIDIAMTAILTLLAYTTWTRGLRRYSSASG